MLDLHPMLKGISVWECTFVNVWQYVYCHDMYIICYVLCILHTMIFRDYQLNIKLCFDFHRLWIPLIPDTFF